MICLFIYVIWYFYSEIITEDFYEDVDQYQSSGQKEGNHKETLINLYMIIYINIK